MLPVNGVNGVPVQNPVEPKDVEPDAKWSKLTLKMEVNLVQGNLFSEENAKIFLLVKKMKKINGHYQNDQRCKSPREEKYLKYPIFTFVFLIHYLIFTHNSISLLYLTFSPYSMLFKDAKTSDHHIFTFHHICHFPSSSFIKNHGITKGLRYSYIQKRHWNLWISSTRLVDFLIKSYMHILSVL